MFKFAPAFLLCGLLVSTLTAAHQYSLADVRSEEEALQEALIENDVKSEDEALQRAFIEEDGAEIGQPLKRVKERVEAIPVLKDADDEKLRIITDRIWKADKNRLSASDVVYNFRGPKFFTHVNKELLNAGTYAKMIDLFHYYDAVTLPSRDDFNIKVSAFLDAILDTPPIEEARKWIEKRNRSLGSAITSTFKNALWQHWFTPYSRSSGPHRDSSAFKHTFAGEIDSSTKQVIGLHNWVRMFFEEEKEKLVYKGLKGSCPVEKPFIEKITFDLGQPGQSYRKISSAFIRTSPEVEIALYTICVLTRKNSVCPIRLNGIELTMSVSTKTTGGQKTIKSAYPIC